MCLMNFVAWPTNWRNPDNNRDTMSGFWGLGILPGPFFFVGRTNFGGDRAQLGDLGKWCSTCFKCRILAATMPQTHNFPQMANCGLWTKAGDSYHPTHNCIVVVGLWYPDVASTRGRMQKTARGATCKKLRAGRTIYQFRRAGVVCKSRTANMCRAFYSCQLPGPSV